MFNIFKPKTNEKLKLIYLLKIKIRENQYYFYKMETGLMKVKMKVLRKQNLIMLKKKVILKFKKIELFRFAKK